MDIEIVTRKFYDYSRHVRGYTPATVRWYQMTLRLYTRLMEIKTIEDVNGRNLREFFLQGRIQRNWRINSYITFYRALNVFFKWCADNQYLETNPQKDRL